MVVGRRDGGGRKRVAVFGDHHCQTNIVCYSLEINKL